MRTGIARAAIARERFDHCALRAAVGFDFELAGHATRGQLGTKAIDDRVHGRVVAVARGARVTAGDFGTNRSNDRVVTNGFEYAELTRARVGLREVLRGSVTTGGRVTAERLLLRRHH